MKLSRFVIFAAFLVAMAISFSGKAQTSPAPVTKNEKRQLVDSLASILKNCYIFPELGNKAAATIQKEFTLGKYNTVSDPVEIADQLTKDVLTVIQDKHFHVFFDPEQVAMEQQAMSSNDSSEMINEELEKGKLFNHGFKEVKILDGNIGYINLTGFHDLAPAKETVDGVMNFLNDAKSIIIDLRNNQGGASDLGPYLAAYFFKKDPIVLYDFYIRDGVKSKHEVYTLAETVNGKRRPEVPVYILTSPFTFSAAEAFSYTMQSLKRATIVGERTGGGAHMWTGKIASKRFYVHVPYARPIDPRTQTNWETTGVQPDVAIAGRKALTTTTILALEKLMATDTANKARYMWHLEAAKAKIQGVEVDRSTMQRYAGNYGSKSITFEQNKLYFQWNGIDCELIPMSDELFRIEEFNYFRIKMVYDANKVVTGITILNDNGSSRYFPRDR